MHSVLHTFGFSIHVTSFMHIHIWACMVSAFIAGKEDKRFSPVLHEVTGFVIIVCFCYFYFFLHTCEHCISQSTFTVLHTPLENGYYGYILPPPPPHFILC